MKETEEEAQSGGIDFESLKELTSDIDLNLMSEKALHVLWTRFSEIQCAGWMCLNNENKERFEMWLKSGNDEDAWS